MRLNPESIARASSKHPWRTVGLWFVVFVLAGASSSALLGSALTTDIDFTNTPEAKEAQQILEQRRLEQDIVTENWVIAGPGEGAVDDPAFVEAFPNAILNVHPSLLPSFPGLDAQHQAWSHGVKMSGATVHFVTAELDAGPIVLQAAVPVLDDDTVESLSARILVEEHRLYPAAIATVLGGGWRVDGRRVIRG